MNARSIPWIVAAVVQAIAIALLVWQLASPDELRDDRPSAAARAPTIDERAEPHDASDDPPENRLEDANDNAPAQRSTPATAPAAMHGTLVHGTVRMPDDAELPATVRLSMRPAEDSKALADATLRGDNTAFAWPDVSPGSYEISVRGTGLRRTTHRFEVPQGVADVFVEVPLEPSWLVNVLLTTPQGKPLHEALTGELRQQLGLSPFFEVQVVAMWQAIPDDLPTSTLRNSPFTVARWQSAHGIAAGRGSRELPARYAGVLEMPERRDAFAAVLMKEVVLARAPLAKDQGELELTVDPAKMAAALATLRFALVDPDGNPLAGARVDVSDRQSSGTPGKVDEDGNYEQANMLPGRYPFRVTSDGHIIQPCEITLLPGATTDLGRVVALPKRTITVRFEGLVEGKRLSGSVQPLEFRGNPSLSRSSQRIYMRKGEAKLQLAEGRYRLRATGAGGAVVEFDTRTLGDEPLVVQLQPEAAVQFDTTTLAIPARLVIRAANGAKVFDRWITWQSRWDRSMLPGAYQVTLTELGGKVRSLTLEVPAGGTAIKL